MKYIITESQNIRLQLLRRDMKIKNLISKYIERTRTNPVMVGGIVIAELSNELGVDNDSPDFDLIASFIRKNYTDYINELWSQKKEK